MSFNHIYSKCPLTSNLSRCENLVLVLNAHLHNMSDTIYYNQMSGSGFRILMWMKIVIRLPCNECVMCL